MVKGSDGGVNLVVSKLYGVNATIVIFLFVCVYDGGMK